MAKFNRDQFKATKVSDLKKQDEEVEQKINSGNNGRAGVLELNKDGSKNKLRIFPKHPGTKSWIYPKSVHFLKVTYIDNDGNPIKDDQGNDKVGKKPIFNSRVHGNTQKDIVDEYIDFVYKKAFDEIKDDKRRKEYLRPIEGWKSAGQYHPGIKAQTRWMVYGDLNGKFGRVELPTTVKNRLNEISAGQDDDGDVIVVDPFTDIDDGRKVFISFDRNQKDPSKKYSTSIDLMKSTPLTDQQFSQLAEQKPLEQLYYKVYRRKDFMMAMEGLKTFDEESAQVLQSFGFDAGYEVFTYDEFLDVAEEISEYYPDDEEEQEEDDQIFPSQEEVEKRNVLKKKNQQREQEEEEVPFDTNDVDQSKDLSQMTMVEMKKYIKDNGLTIRILPSYTEDQVRQFIQEEQELIRQEQEESEEREQPDPAPKRKSRLAGLKNKVSK